MDIFLPVSVHTHRIRKMLYFNSCLMKNLTGQNVLPDQLSDSTETPEQTEDMTYKETVRLVRSFMGWHHIPAFESDYSEPDKSNNPWKGKQPRKPTRISVAMPQMIGLCQKLERLNFEL